MAGLQLSLRMRNARLVAKNFEDFTQEVKKISAGRIYGRLQSARKRVSNSPPRYAGKPEHKWASDKQRRYVMWAIREGVIQYPYQRTGRYGASWRVEKTPQGDGYLLTSNYPAAKWIAGTARDPDMQYHLHKTRWIPLRLAIEEVITELPKEIQADAVLVARRRGM